MIGRNRPCAQNSACSQSARNKRRSCDRLADLLNQSISGQTGEDLIDIGSQMLVGQPCAGYSFDLVRNFCCRQNLDLGITGKMLTDWCLRCDGLQLDFPDDISLDEELYICTRMIGRTENLGGNLSPVCVHAMNVQQFVVDALDV